VVAVALKLFPQHLLLPQLLRLLKEEEVVVGVDQKVLLLLVWEGDRG